MVCVPLENTIQVISSQSIENLSMLDMRLRGKTKMYFIYILFFLSIYQKKFFKKTHVRGTFSS